MPAYYDCNATTPTEPEVLDVVMHYLRDEYGNAGSRTHEFGQVAARAVQTARKEVAEGVGADASEVVFTSGATEANNLAILGLASYAIQQGRRHIVTTLIEHKAVLEPIEQLEKRGFEITRIAPEASGEISADRFLAAVRPDTVLVSIMHANNETGVLQPIVEVAQGLADHPAYMHVDAAQSYGKDDLMLQHQRIDMISVSGHKLFAPQGVGALIARRRDFVRPPLTPLMWGGGQERALRPGTLPVPLIAGFGAAARIARRDAVARLEKVSAIREQILTAFTGIGARFAGGQARRTLPHVLNAYFEGVNSEALMLSLKNIVAVSNGSACSANSYLPSHVLTHMGLNREWIDGAIRLSWSHLSEEVSWKEVCTIIQNLRGT